MYYSKRGGDGERPINNKRGSSTKQKAKRKELVRRSFDKAVKLNGEALERLSKQ